MEQLTFNLDSFKGPLDLLLVLIKKNKINIYDIPISEILEQYLEVMKQMKEMDLEISSEFLVLAATLLQIKSKMLLPIEDNDEEGQDPREELVKRLIEYKMFKDKVDFFREKENEGYKMFCKLPEPMEEAPVVYDYSNLNIDMLFEAYNISCMKQIRKLPPPKKSFVGIVGHEKVSIREKVKNIWKNLFKKTKMKFKDIFKGTKTKPEAVASFLAVLELIKLKKIRIEGEMENCSVFVTDTDEKFNLEGIDE